MRIIKQHNRRRDNASGQTIPALPHDPEDGDDGQGAHQRGHGAVGDVGDFVGDVGVADVFEEEGAVVADEPAGEGEEEFAERRVHVEEVGALEVVGGELYETPVGLACAHLPPRGRLVLFACGVRTFPKCTSSNTT
jgi:hypothetical protein